MQSEWLKRSLVEQLIFKRAQPEVQNMHVYPYTYLHHGLAYICFSHSLCRAEKGLSNGILKPCIHKKMSKLEYFQNRKAVIFRRSHEMWGMKKVCFGGSCWFSENYMVIRMVKHLLLSSDWSSCKLRLRMWVRGLRRKRYGSNMSDNYCWFSEKRKHQLG